MRIAESRLRSIIRNILLENDDWTDEDAVRLQAIHNIEDQSWDMYAPTPKKGIKLKVQRKGLTATKEFCEKIGLSDQEGDERKFLVKEVELSVPNEASFYRFDTEQKINRHLRGNAKVYRVGFEGEKILYKITIASNYEEKFLSALKDKGLKNYTLQPMSFHRQ